MLLDVIIVVSMLMTISFLMVVIVTMLLGLILFFLGSFSFKTIACRYQNVQLLEEIRAPLSRHSEDPADGVERLLCSRDFLPIFEFKFSFPFSNFIVLTHLTLGIFVFFCG